MTSQTDANADQLKADISRLLAEIPGAITKSVSQSLKQSGIGDEIHAVALQAVDELVKDQTARLAAIVSPPTVTPALRGDPDSGGEAKAQVAG